MKRIVVYVEQGAHLELKSKLASQGTSISDWFRTQVDSFLASPKKFSKKIPEARVTSGFASIPVTMGGPDNVGPTTFKLCKAKFCNNYAEDGDFCKEHKNG